MNPLNMLSRWYWGVTPEEDVFDAKVCTIELNLFTNLIEDVWRNEIRMSNV